MRSRHIEIAVVSPLAEEWAAVCNRITKALPVDDSPLPAIEGWIGAHSVVSAACGKGEPNTAAAVQFVSTRWQPRWIFLVGIAGGFPDKGVHRGDLVVGSFVYHIDFGKLVQGQYVRRPENDFAPDRFLLATAEIALQDSSSDWRSKISLKRPDGRKIERTKSHVGYVVSGDKVVDDVGQSFFRAVRATIPEAHAVEMEAAGAGAAVRLEQARRTVGFLMIRGISDEPRESQHTVGTGSEQREQWKRFASDVSATFVENLILRLPTSSRSSSKESDQKSEPTSVIQLLKKARSLRESLTDELAPDVDLILARTEDMIRQESLFGSTESTRAAIWKALFDLHKLFLDEIGTGLFS